MSESEPILYEVRNKVTIITLNIPEKLNSLTKPQFILLAKLMERADKEDTVVTIIQSTGRYFSAGANLEAGKMLKMEPSVLFSHEYWLDNFVAKNVFLTDVFHNHSKVLVAALNGPVVGVSAALVSLCDLVYAINDTKLYLHTPFTALGLLAEGASSSTFFSRLGWSKSAEALLLSKPIPGVELTKLGFINKSYNEIKFDSVEQFNEKVHEDIVSQFTNLYEPSILANKQLLKSNRDQVVDSSAAKEVIKTFNNFVEGIPQQIVAQNMQRARKSKI